MNHAEDAILTEPLASTEHAPAAPDLLTGARYAAPLQTGARLQEFEISTVIGQGGFGIVYLARDLSLQRSVAIKEYFPVHLAGRDVEGTVRALTPGQAEVLELGRRSFINEARMLARFKHTGLVEVLRFWEQNGTAYMAMPFYDGATLTQYLKRHPGVATEAWLRKTLKPLLEALGHMHQEDCFHRDVAPDNILILKDGSAVLLDLGAARRVIANDAQAMTVMLKPGYAPIEQYSDDPRFRQGPWTDIYAMAAVFFFAVTGKAPPASASRVMRDSVSPLASVRPEGFSESFLLAIDKGLSLQPDDRPRSIAEFGALLYAAPQQPEEAAELTQAPRAAGDAAAAGTKTSAWTSGNAARRITGDAEAENSGDAAAAPRRAPALKPAGLAAGVGVLAVAVVAGWLS
ncbi:MAG: serine/threonine protein kinase, partial [Lautropia sp.]|nr:serine/threonine protein kinase [Lautropia sp.]